MGRILTCILLLCASAIGFPAHADTISTFNVAASHGFRNDPGTSVGPPVSGTITIDTTTGQVLSVDLVSYPNLISLGWLVGTSRGLTEINESFDTSLNHNVQFTSIDILLPTESLIAYSGGFICSTAHDCDGNNSIYGRGPVNQDILDGELTPVPEPFSILLVATGLLGVVRAKSAGVPTGITKTE